MEGKRVVDFELGSILEHIRDGVLTEVPGKRVRDIGEHKGNVVGQCAGEGVGQGRERVVHSNSIARDGTIGEDENGANGVDLFSNLICNTPLVELVLLNIASAGEPRSVEDANLVKRLRLFTSFKDFVSYHYAVLTRKFIMAGAVGLTLIARTTFLVGVVEDIEVVVINVVASKNIADESHD